MLRTRLPDSLDLDVNERSGFVLDGSGWGCHQIRSRTF